MLCPYIYNLQGRKEALKIVQVASESLWNIGAKTKTSMAIHIFRQGKADLTGWITGVLKALGPSPRR